MPKILVTGGPVSTSLDAVKVITNRFKGGLMKQLADALSKHPTDLTWVSPLRFSTNPGAIDVTYLTEVGEGFLESSVLDDAPVKMSTHCGLEDYRKQVLKLAPQMDAVVLGAAVANLMPQKPWTDKFPSHQYGPDDVIPINFVLTPRIINEVKKVAPYTHLFGFKLLANADHEELISAAYEIVLAGRCTAVFANDRSNLNIVYAVTKERAVHPMVREDISAWILGMIRDEYYHTECHFLDKQIGRYRPKYALPVQHLKTLLQRFASRFSPVEGGLIFGTVATRMSDFPDGFVTTPRGKKELSTFVMVLDVHHDNKIISVRGNTKATLNAPLLHRIFQDFPEVQSVVHYHAPDPSLIIHDYAPPGTVRDSMRPLGKGSFNIANHGCFLLLDKNGETIL